MISLSYKNRLSYWLGRFNLLIINYFLRITVILAFSGNEITCSTHKIPVSKNHRDELMKRIDQRLIRK
ncbi:hypothetical protein AAHN97_23850 [Chitinophaga niabensis]|uniref:hypothetical protein n=1 Tax=Chitinophaga niabensis TaxID=536979 RepID=UPI0031BA4A0F